MSDPEMAKFLEGVVGTVEATRFEYYSLWLANHEAMDWKENFLGHVRTVGHVDDMPVCVSLITGAVDGHKLLFFHATSQVVDHRMIDKWLEDNLSDSAKNGDCVNRADASNFRNVFPHRILEAS